MADISLRAMQEEDLAFVALLEQESFHDAWNEAMLKNELDNPLSTYLILLKDGEPIGYAGYWLVVGEAQVTRVAVLQRERGQGYGRLLTKGLLDSAWEQQAEAVTLEVRESNVPAQRAYLSNGFTSAGVRPNYYEDTHEGAVIMWVHRGQ